jgi:hypothetical protein
MLNNLTSPGASGPVGTVAQEETTDKTTPPIKTAINIDFIITNLLLIIPIPISLGLLTHHPNLKLPPFFFSQQN